MPLPPRSPSPSKDKSTTDSLQSDQEIRLEDLRQQFHQASDSLFDIERELAEVFLESVQPMKSIYERTHRHTAFRSAICSIFADPEDIDLVQYERDHEDL
jgi:hypothetical protein